MISKDALENIYSDLNELSNKELQINHWLKGDFGKISGYTELMCRLFDDDDFDLFVDKEIYELKVSNDFVEEIRLLRDQLNLYNENSKSRIEIINDPEWDIIRKQAKKVIDLWKAELLKS